MGIDVSELKRVYEALNACSAETEPTRSALFRAQTTLADVIYSSEVVDLVLQHYNAANKRFLNAAMQQHRNKLIGDVPPPNPATAAYDAEWSYRLAAAAKALFYFTRAYYDAVYRLFLASLGQPSGSGSMNQAADSERNPLHLLLAQNLPAFLPYFREFRQIRNDIKWGKPQLNSDVFSSGGSSDPIMHFNTNQQKFRDVPLRFLYDINQHTVFLTELLLNQVLQQNLTQPTSPPEHA